MNIINGGWLAGRRTYILSVVGIMTSVGAYLIGDTDIYVMMQAVFTFGAIFFLRQATEEK